MIRRSLTVGVLAGLLLSLASLYPAISLLTPTLLPNWEPVAGDLWHGVLLMLSAGVGLPTLLGFGFVAAQRAGRGGCATAYGRAPLPARLLATFTM